MTPALLVVALLAPPRGAAPAPPGVYYEQLTQSVVGSSPRGAAVKTRVYSTGRRMRLESGEAEGGPALVLRLDEDRAFRLDPAAKIARLLDLTRLRAQSQMDVGVAGEALGATEEGAARTTPLAGSKVVAGRTCRGFKIASAQASLEVYVAQVGVGIEAFTDFLEWSGAGQSLGSLLDELRGFPAFPWKPAYAPRSTERASPPSPRSRRSSSAPSLRPCSRFPRAFAWSKVPPP